MKILILYCCYTAASAFMSTSFKKGSNDGNKVDQRVGQESKGKGNMLARMLPCPDGPVPARHLPPPKKFVERGWGRRLQPGLCESDPPLPLGGNGIEVKV